MDTFGRLQGHVAKKNSGEFVRDYSDYDACSKNYLCSIPNRTCSMMFEYVQFCSISEITYSIGIHVLFDETLGCENRPQTGR